MSFTPGTIEGTIRHLRTSFQGAILLVEGVDDSRFWKARLNKAECRVLFCGGKPQTLASMERINTAGIQGILAIVDRDLDDIIGMQREIPNVFSVGEHDLEALLIRSRALEVALAEFADEDLIDTQQQSSGRSLRELLIERATVFGKVRWLLLSEASVEPFDRFSPRRFLDETSWTLKESLFDELALALRCTREEVLERISGCPTCDEWVLCHGKDLVAILAIGIRRVIGTRKVSSEDIARSLRAGLDRNDLIATSIGRSLTGWISCNPTFAFSLL